MFQQGHCFNLAKVVPGLWKVFQKLESGQLMWRKDGVMSGRQALEDNAWSVSFNENPNEMKCLNYQPIIPTTLFLLSHQTLWKDNCLTEHTVGPHTALRKKKKTCPAW